jgi:hypothetical protein
LSASWPAAPARFGRLSSSKICATPRGHYLWAHGLAAGVAQPRARPGWTARAPELQ